MEEHEIWKQIEDSHYSVSNFGRVRNDYDNYILKGHIRKDGYLDVHLDTALAVIRVHKLVALAFVEIPEELLDTDLTVDHDDDNKLNNHYTNLVWMTRADNIKKGFK